MRWRSPVSRAVLRGALLALSLGFLARFAWVGWPDIAAASSSLAIGQLPLLALAVVLEAAWMLCLAQVYGTSLGAVGGRIAVGEALRISMGAFAVSRILPGGGAAGSVFAARELVAAGNPGPVTIASMVISWWLSMTTLGVVVVTGTAVSALHGRLSVSYLFPSGLTMAVLLCGGALGIAALRSRCWRRRLLRTVHRALSKLGIGAPVEEWERSLDAVATRLRRRSRLIAVVAWSAGGWLLDAGALWLAFAAFGYHLDPGVLLVGYGLVNLIGALPELTPGWLGVLETALAVTYSALGVPAGVAVVAVLCYRLVSYWLPVAAGVPFGLSMLRRPRPVSSPGSPAEAQVAA